MCVCDGELARILQFLPTPCSTVQNGQQKSVTMAILPRRILSSGKAWWRRGRPLLHKLDQVDTCTSVNSQSWSAPAFSTISSSNITGERRTWDKDQALPLVIDTDGGVPIHLYAHEIELQALQQLHILATSPVPTDYISVMPDAHLGKGVTVGTVFASRDYVCPNAVGVDIGCGMAAVPLEGLYSWDLYNNKNEGEPSSKLVRIQQKIKASVPTGFNQHRATLEGTMEVIDEITAEVRPTIYLEEQLLLPRVTDQLGTLGGGNHFLELVYDEASGQVWVLLHSGSRNIGNRVATHYDKVAQQWLVQHHHDTKPLKGIHYMPIESQEGQDYLRDMEWCQHYAHHNRRIMKEIMLRIVEQETGCFADYSRAVNIHHNYCQCENCGDKGSLWVTRKGATSARLGEMGIIPGSMGTGSYITRGKGNLQSWNSSSHGAGRVLSRTKAHSEISQEDFEASMKGILCDTHPSVKDEAPQAYKDLTQVMEDQTSLTEIVVRLRPLLNVKGFESKLPKRYRKNRKKTRHKRN